MNADSYFSIGKSHKVCQDYAISLQDGSGIVISDGCSSSPLTDNGARILALRTSKLLQTGFPTKLELYYDIIGSNYFLNLPERALDATLLYAKIKDNQYMINVIGDGVITISYKNNDIKVYDISYPSGAPLYLSYDFNPERKEAFKKEYGIKRIIKEFYLLNGEKDYVSEYSQNNEEPFSLLGSIEDIETIALMSDGVQSYVEGTERMRLENVLEEMLGFKNWAGEFVNRRMVKFEKECVENNIKHTDDVSIACVHLDNT